MTTTAGAHPSSLLNVFRAFPESARPLIEYHEVVLRGPAPFSEAERELIAAYVSSLNQFGYCTSVHVATAENLGIPAGLVRKLVENPALTDATTRCDRF